MSKKSIVVALYVVFIPLSLFAFFAVKSSEPIKPQVVEQPVIDTKTERKVYQAKPVGNINDSRVVGNIYEDNDIDSETYERSTFGGYDCTDDCSGHEAGYEWAEEKGILDPDNCGGNSQSFIEGCQAYAEENGF